MIDGGRSYFCFWWPVVNFQFCFGSNLWRYCVTHACPCVWEWISLSIAWVFFSYTLRVKLISRINCKLIYCLLCLYSDNHYVATLIYQTSLASQFDVMKIINATLIDLKGIYCQFIVAFIEQTCKCCAMGTWFAQWALNNIKH